MRSKSKKRGCSPRGRWQLDTTQWLHFHFSLSCIGEGNGNPLQCSCLENPRDGGAWWAAVYGAAQSQTRLERLSSSSSSMADSLCCTAETNTTLSSNYTPIMFFEKSSEIPQIWLVIGSQRGSILSCWSCILYSKSALSQNFCSFVWAHITWFHFYNYSLSFSW